MTKREERALEIYQEFILDNGIVLKSREEKLFMLAIYESLASYKSMRVEGKEEDIRSFKKGLPRFASHHNVTIINN